jgi:hypothetical protein
MTKPKMIFFSIALLLCTAIGAIAQSGTVAAGGDASGAGGTVSYSIGQTDYITENGTGGTITQGLQQPYEILIVTGIEVKDINLSFSVYPNPTADFVVLSVKEIATENMSYVLCDVQGKVIDRKKISSNETQITVVELSKATYLIKVLDNNKEVKTFKIIKN